jgi:hypothetical protein
VAGKGTGVSKSIGVRGRDIYRLSALSLSLSTVILNNNGLISGRKQVVEGLSAWTSTSLGMLSGVEQQVAEVELVVECITDSGMKKDMFEV